MGRSRGGLTTKIHALVDAEGRAVHLSLSPGQAHDCPAGEALLETVQPSGILLADKAYDSQRLRAEIHSQGGWANVPSRRNAREKPAFSQWIYRQRNLVERFFNKLKQFRGLATRYDKRPENFLAAIKIVSIRLWLRH